MNRSLWSAGLVGLIALGVSAQGCIFGECDNGADNCVQLEPAVTFEAAEQDQSVPWTPGSGLVVDSMNGKVTVVQGSGSDVEVTFGPFVSDKAENEDSALAYLEDNIVLEAEENGGDVIVRVSRRDSGSINLGAHITVSLPAGFDGDFEIAQGNGSVAADLKDAQPASTKVINDGAGDITVAGAQGSLTIQADVGDVDVDIAAWGGGTIFTGNGDVILTVPADVDGTMTLNADGELTESGIPETWAVSGEGNSKAYTMGAGEGPLLEAETDFGDASLIVE